MCMDRCCRCDKTVNTDDYPEVDREELDHSCICDACWQEVEPSQDALFGRVSGWGLMLESEQVA